MPTRFRDVVAASGDEGIMITGMDECLFGYTLVEWSELERRILEAPSQNNAYRRFSRKFIGRCQECRFDSQGRILIPPVLKQYAGLTKDVVLVGVLKRFEIWSRERWESEDDQMERDMEDESLRDAIAQLGL